MQIYKFSNWKIFFPPIGENIFQPYNTQIFNILLFQYFLHPLQHISHKALFICSYFILFIKHTNP